MVEEEVRAHEWERRAVGWRFLLAPSAALRRMLLVGVGVAAAQQIVGIDGIQYFMLYLLEQSRVRDRGARFGILVGLGAFKLVCVFASGRFLVDRWGRRPTLIASSLGCACALMLLATNFLINTESIPQYANAAPALSVVALAMYFGAFSLGVGLTCWLVPAEVFPTAVRAKAMALATFANRAVAALVASRFLTLADAMGYGGASLLLATFCLLVAAFVYVAVPETKGRTLEEMTAHFCEATGDESARLVLDQAAAECCAARRGRGGEGGETATGK